MKVVQINAVYKFSSTGRTTMEMHQYLKQQGVESYVITAFSPVKDAGVFVFADGLGMKLHGFLSRITGLNAYFSSLSTIRVVRLLKKFAPDVVHLRNLHGNFINVPMLLHYLKKTQPHVVITLHDCWFYTGKCTHYTVAKCYKWKKNCGSCPQLKCDIPSWFFDRTSKMLDDKRTELSGIKNLDVVGVSKWISQECEQSYLGKCSEVSTIYNWINLSRFRILDEKEYISVIDRYSLRDKRIVLAVANVWNQKKGLDVLNSVARVMPDEYRFLIIGTVADQMELDTKIICCGETDSVEELVRFYNAADVLLNVSKEESFGKVSAEAVSCGTPVVCFDSTANPEIVANGCGMIVTDERPIMVKEAICKIVSNGKPVYQELCRRMATENFCMEDNIRRYIELYEK